LGVAYDVGRAACRPPNTSANREHNTNTTSKPGGHQVPNRFMSPETTTAEKQPSSEPLFVARQLNDQHDIQTLLTSEPSNQVPICNLSLANAERPN
jgi:hypothetical protein